MQRAPRACATHLMQRRSPLFSVAGTSSAQSNHQRQGNKADGHRSSSCLLKASLALTCPAAAETQRGRPRQVASQGCSPGPASSVLRASPWQEAGGSLLLLLPAVPTQSLPTFLARWDSIAFGSLPTRPGSKHSTLLGLDGERKE